MQFSEKWLKHARQIYFSLLWIQVSSMNVARQHFIQILAVHRCLFKSRYLGLFLCILSSTLLYCSWAQLLLSSIHLGPNNTHRIDFSNHLFRSLTLGECIPCPSCRSETADGLWFPAQWLLYCLSRGHSGVMAYKMHSPRAHISATK